MSSQFRKKFGTEGLGQLSTAIQSAVRGGFEAGNPGGEGSLVEVAVSSGTGNASIETSARYATVAGWSALPTTPGVSFTVADNIISVKTNSGFSGSIYFWVFS